jgi:hypothetical protein
MLIVSVIFQLGCNNQIGKGEPTALIRCDDIGMCHAVNIATQRLVDTGIPFSASIMFCCPWYQEAVEILKNQPQVSCGVHLTLNAEWKNYRWGPILGKEAVPSLVNEKGFFFPSRKTLFDNNPQIDEVEKELRAQIERALESGLEIDYIDYHMGAAINTPELVELVENLADEYELGISRWYGEKDIKGIYNATPDSKLDTLMSKIKNLKENQLNLLVFHIGETTPEMNVMEDINEFGLENMSEHREAEADALCSSKFRNYIQNSNINLVNYKELIKSKGLKNMQRPEDYQY